jgi:hypothetical protein
VRSSSSAAVDSKADPAKQRAGMVWIGGANIN